MLVHLENEDFNEMIKDDLVIVDFYANWCGPCKMLSKVIESYDGEGKLDILKVNVDESNELANKYQVFSIPTVVVLENGKEIKRRTGFMSLSEFEGWVSEDEK